MQIENAGKRCPTTTKQISQGLFRRKKTHRAGKKIKREGQITSKKYTNSLK